MDDGKEISLDDMFDENDEDESKESSSPCYETCDEYNSDDLKIHKIGIFFSL